MPTSAEITNVLERTRSYFIDSLLPFWMNKSPDPEYGGFLSYFDRDGRPTGETAKPFLMQIRMLFAMSAAHRAGYGGGGCAELARNAADFIIDHYWDHENEGWQWIADRENDRARGLRGWAGRVHQRFRGDPAAHEPEVPLRDAA